MKVHTIILAAGSGSRMQSLKAKSLQKVAGMTMIERIIKTAKEISDQRISEKKMFLTLNAMW